MYAIFLQFTEIPTGAYSSANPFAFGCKYRVQIDGDFPNNSRLADVHVSTLVRLEAAGWKVAPGNATTIDRVTTVLENKGVEFIENGVRLTKRPRR